MSWDDLPDSFHRLARDVCTPRQLQVLILRSNELTFEEIGQRLGIRRPTAHRHLHVAHNKLRRVILERTNCDPVANEALASQSRILTAITSEDS